MRKDLNKYYRIDFDEPNFVWTYGITAAIGYLLLVISTDFGWQIFALGGAYFVSLFVSMLRIKSRTCKKY